MPRSDFDLDAYLASEAHEPGPNSPVTLEARVNANLAKILRETPLNPGMTLKPDGEGFRIKAEVRENQALYRWILGHGKAIEILRPTSLRKSIAETVRDAASPLRLIHDASCRIRQRTCRIDTFPEAPHAQSLPDP